MKHKIILVEDDPDDCDLFQYFYGDREDLEFLPSLANGEELIEYLNSIPSPDGLPDAIVMDHNMPRMSGKETLEVLQADARYRDIPVLIYSTYRDANLVLECTRFGARMICAKPVDDEGYQKMMDDFLLVVAGFAR